MTLLVLDTAGGVCGALVRAPGRPDLARVEEIGRGHDQRLAALVAETLEQAAIAPSGLTKIAVIVGLGSFTGVRVGVAFARGLALALEVPAVGVNGLDALAAALADAPVLLAAYDAKRDELAWRGYRFGAPAALAGEGTDDAMRMDRVETVAQILAQLRQSEPEAMVAGSGAARLGVEAALLRAPLSAAADLAETLTPETAPARPLYHRPPDAKLPGGREPDAA